jgi:F0F1-type ATP synthase delta subunit
MVPRWRDDICVGYPIEIKHGDKWYAGIVRKVENRNSIILAVLFFYSCDFTTKFLNISDVYVTSVKKTKNNIQELLHNQYGSKIKLEFQVNKSLLGGMTVVIGSKMIDLSIINQVSKFTNNVKGDI